MPCTHISVHTKSEKVFHVETKISLIGASRASWPGPWTTKTTLLSVAWCGHKLHLVSCRLLTPRTGKTQLQNRRLKAIDFLNLFQCHSPGLISQAEDLHWAKGTHNLNRMLLDLLPSYPGRSSHITNACIPPRKASLSHSSAQTWNVGL